MPRQVATGSKPKLLGISKRGNKYLRKPLIHGALRDALVAGGPDAVGAWLCGVVGRVRKDEATAALANKLARTAWAVLRRGRPSDAAKTAAA